MSGAPILFLVVGKPTEDNEKHLILTRLSQELKTWNEHLAGCRLETELENLVKSEVKVITGQKELVLTSDKLSLIVLFNPTLAGFKHFSKEYLAVKSCYRQLIYSGPALNECGSWLLQDGVLQFGDLARILKDLEMPDFEPFYVNSFSIGKWTQDNIEKLTSLCIKLNPEMQEGSPDVGSRKLSEILSGFFEENVFVPDHFDEKEKFSVSCFRAPNQNCTSIRIGDFKMFVNADSTKLPLQIYQDSDLILLTTPDVRSFKWLQSSFESGNKFHFGMLYSNALSSISQKALDAGECGDKGLLINTSDTLKSLTKSLNNANIPVQSCFSSNNHQPTTIYHKAGFGTLQLYPLTPSADNKEVKELQKSQNCENVISNFPSSSCVLLWQPFNKKQPPIRMFFSGFVPQQMLFESLIKMKNLQCFSSWDGLNPVESMNKLNKLKSKVTSEKPGMTNGTQKAKDLAKAAAAKQKATDSSSATSHSAHGDSVTTAKTQPKPKPAKVEGDKTHVVPKHEKLEKNKPNVSVSSTPGKTETAKLQPKTRQSLPLKPAVKVTAKEISTKPSTVSTTGPSTKPPTTNVTTKQALPSKCPAAPKPTKEVKPAAKAPVPTAKAKPSTQPKKETSLPEKKVAASPKLEKKAKPVKASEKKDAEKKDKKDTKIDTKIIGRALIKDQVAIKEEMVDLISLEKENLNKEEQLSDKKSEVSALTSPAEDKSDQLISSKEQDELELEVHATEDDEEKVEEKPAMECEVEEEMITSDKGKEVQSEVRVEDEHLLTEEVEAPTDDLDADSLGNETEKDHLEVETEEAVATEDLEEEREDEIVGDPDHGTFIEPTKLVIDEMVRSGISLAESAGTESAPNENLYSQDLGEESPMEEEEEEEEEIDQMEKTLLQSKAFESEDLKDDIEAEVLDSSVEQDQAEGDLGEECIEKDMIEELEKKKETKVSSDDKHEVQEKSLAEGFDTCTGNLPTKSCDVKSECVVESSRVPDIEHHVDESVEVCEEEDEIMVDEDAEEGLIEKDLIEPVEKDLIEPVEKVSVQLDDESLHGTKQNGFPEEATKGDDKCKDLLVEKVDVSQTDAPVEESKQPTHHDDDDEDLDILKSQIVDKENVAEEYVTEENVEENVVDDVVDDIEMQEDKSQEEIKKVDEFDDDVVRIDEKEDWEGSQDTEELTGEKHDQKKNVEINLDYFADEGDDVANVETTQGMGDVDLRKQLAEEKSPLSDQVFDAKENDGDRLIDFENSDDLVGISFLKKDSGMEDLAAICTGILPSDSDNLCSESADSTTAVAGSVSGPQSVGDDDKFSKEDLNQFCGEIADHLNIIKEHRDAVQKELQTDANKDVVFYNKNVAFHKERADELSEEDQDELETISEHPEIEEEEELLMNKNEGGEDNSSTPIKASKAEASDQLIDFDEASSGDAKKLQPDSLDCKVGVSLDADPLAKVGEHGVKDLSPEDAPAIHSSSTVDELVAAWGDPMKLPSPEKPKKLNLKKEGTTQESNPPAAVPIAADQAAKKKPATAKPVGEATKITRAAPKTKSSSDDRRKPDPKPVHISHPFYTDVAFVYERDDERHGAYNADFFKKVRSHHYILSSAHPAVLDHLLDAKQTWEEPEVPVVAIVSKLDWVKVEEWVRSKKAILDSLNITIHPDLNQNISDLHLRTF